MATMTDKTTPREVGLSEGLGAACSTCPFRLGAALGYDDDALEALADGWEPSCHQIVGMQAIFHEPFPTSSRCRGHDAWARGDAGFAAPNARLTAPHTAQRSDDE